MMAGAVGQVFYYVDEQGNLTGIESKMSMKNGSETRAMLHLSELGEVTFENYIVMPE